MRNANLAATMLLGGLWHGAGWTFVIWGGLHGTYLAINHAWSRLAKRVPALARFSTTRTYAILALLLTQLCVVVAWVFFRATSLDASIRMLSPRAKAAPSFGPMRTIVGGGEESSLRIVPTPWPWTMVALLGLLRFTRNVSSGSLIVSPFTATVMVCWTVPGTKFNVPEAAV